MDHGFPPLIFDLAIVLGVAAVTTLLFRRLRQPAVLGYLLAGLIVGPHVPVPLAAEAGNIRTLAELGVILLMFSVGLEFDLRKLAREGVPAVVVGSVQVGAAVALVSALGRALGWSAQEAALMGAALAVSSTMIIAKLFQEHGSRGPFRDLVFSVLVVQDLFAVLLLAGLDTSAASGGVGWALAKVALFVAGALAAGGLLVPPLLRWAADHGRGETLLVAAMGACFAGSAIAARVGVSPALGAFAAGMLAFASRRGEPIERLVQPVRDMFGAIFFVAVGMLLDPKQLAAQTGPILLLSAGVLVACAVGGAFGAALVGLPVPRGIQVGLALAQPGELSFVLVGVGSAAGLLWPHAFPVVAGVAFVTAVAGPWTFKAGGPLAERLWRRMPRRLQRLAAPREPLQHRDSPAPLAAPVAFLLLDALVFNLLLLATFHPRAQPLLARHPLVAPGLLAAALGGLLLLAWVLFRRAGQIATLVAGAPRRDVGLLRLAILVGISAPTFALLPAGPAFALLTGLLVCVAVLFRTPAAAGTQAGSEWILKQVGRPWAELCPTLATVRVEIESPFTGRPVSDLQAALQDLPEADLVAFHRDGHWLPVDPAEHLEPGRLVALAGSAAGLRAATDLLNGR